MATEQQLQDALFGPDPVASCLLAESTDDGRQRDGRRGLRALVSHVLDLERHRLDLPGRPLRACRTPAAAATVGALLTELAAIAVERGYGRVEWSVLNWNEPAHGFYRRLGAAPQDEWTVWRLTGPALAALGEPETR